MYKKALKLVSNCLSFPCNQVEYESEEFETKEVMKEVEEEVMIPQVKTLYRYQGQGMGFARGEIFILVSKKNKDWWAVRYTCSNSIIHVNHTIKMFCGYKLS